LAEVALGWLGWAPPVALDADVNAIRVAYAGRVGMLKAVFGGGASERAKPEGQAITPELFDAMFPDS
jgi:hypothetical protein